MHRADSANRYCLIDSLPTAVNHEELHMEKLRLTLDDLGVQSFATSSGLAANGGTVRGQEATEATCAGQATCAYFTCDTLYVACASAQCQVSYDGDASCYCLSAGCGGSDGCPSGGYCNSFYASGCR